MRLKRVKIFGFKTFADRTEFELDGDMIAVVGPNGCGKSNIVDAILWGLGEPNARNLRAQTGQEVIFSGSARRKPLGFAEVTLLFDNEDGALGIDSPEVAITRRLTRSGDSEYQINRRTCRLRDIYELLADSGLGRAGYAIVSQKEIDAALAASPEDRRAWIDEAAGVQRYRVRRQEAFRRLDAAQLHLSRVEDILTEIETSREPLRLEAETAQRYRQIQEALREIESGLLVLELAGSVDELVELESRIASAGEKAAQESRQAEVLDAEAKRLTDRLAAVERELDRLRAQHQEAIARAERAQAQLELAEQRLKSLDDFEQTFADEFGAADHRRQEFESDLARAIEEEKVEVEGLQRLRVEVGGHSGDAQRLTSELEQAEKELGEARYAEAVRLKDEAERQHAKQRRKLALAEIGGIAQSVPELETAIREAESTLESLEAGEAKIRGELKSLREEGDRQRAATENAEGALRSLHHERAVLDGRRRGLEATLETHEGLAQGPRAVLTLVEHGKLDGDYVPVAQALDVEAQHATAIETALGASGHDLIVPDEGHAKRAIALLKEHRLGRATFQPLTLMRPRASTPDLNRVLGERGVVGLASDLVRCRPDHRPVIESLLGRTIVTETLDDSLRLAKTTGWSRLVTLDGEVVHSSGAVSGGHSGRQTSGIVHRQAELKAIEQELKDLDLKIAATEKTAQTATTARDERKDSEEKLRQAIEDGRQDLEDARTWLANLRHELQGALKSKAKLEAELAELATENGGSAPTYDLAALEARRDDLLKQLAARSADAGQAAERLRDAEMRVNQAVQRREIAGRKLAHATEADEHRARKASGLEIDRERTREEIRKRGQELVQAESDRDAAAESVAGAVERKRELSEEEVLVREKAREAERNAASCADLAHQAEVARARADARRASALERLLDEYGLTQEDALARAHETVVPEDAALLVAKMRRELRSMGDVNLGAIEAYQRLTERFEELDARRSDILAGKAEVESSIRVLDQLTRDRFAETFAKVQEAFAHLFHKVFEGDGEGHLRLTNPDDLLATGVEVEVTIPGKRRQRLELLSGGERAMSACAFLFALLHVKPSPLVVLDEVDAPLDGRNVERFIALLREFTDRTQFILITHNNVTIEAADIWFGVTMQEPGVTSLIPLRLPPQHLVEHPIAAAATMKG